MRKVSTRILLIAISFLFLYQGNATMDISVRSAVFKGESAPYLEVYLYVIGSTVQNISSDTNYWQTAVDFVITLEKPDSSISAFDKFTLRSPQSEGPGNFMDIKRFGLLPGHYILRVIAQDEGSPNAVFEFTDEIQIHYENELIEISDIQLLSAFHKSDEKTPFVKNGLYLEPAAFHFYPGNLQILPFYLEVYNPSGQSFKAAYLRYAIYQKRVSGDSLVMQKFKKLDELKVQAFLLQLPIDALESGNYDLVVELRNQEKLLIDVAYSSFQRSNPKIDLVRQIDRNKGFENSFASEMDPEKLRFYLKAIAPLVKGLQSSILEEILLSRDTLAQRYFLYNHFVEISPGDPEFAFTQYMAVAEAVDRAYRSNVGYGFETDRGIIFLKYGKPTEIVEVEDEPSAPPYEIWFYNSLEESRQFNIKFLFYNPSLAHNDFILLHSNCRGERYNPRWEVELYGNAPNEQVGNSSASTQMQENYRRNARKIWDEL